MEDKLQNMLDSDIPEKCKRCIETQLDAVVCWNFETCAECDAPPFEPCKHCPIN